MINFDQITPPEAGSRATSQPAFVTGVENQINQPGFLPEQETMRSVCLAASYEALSHPVAGEDSLVRHLLTVDVQMRPPEGRREFWLAFLTIVGWFVIEDCAPQAAVCSG